MEGGLLLLGRSCHTGADLVDFADCGADFGKDVDALGSRPGDMLDLQLDVAGGNWQQLVSNPAANLKTLQPGQYVYSALVKSIGKKKVGVSVQRADR